MTDVENLAIPAPSDRQVAEAIHWLVKFEGGELSAKDQAAFSHWKSASPLHALAWERLQRASTQFARAGVLGAEKTLQSLDAAERKLQQKRRSLKTLATLGGIGASLWLTRDYNGIGTTGRYWYGQAVADIATATGEQKALTLQDGGRLLLDTRSALDVDFQVRPPLALHVGELSITDSGTAQVRAGSHLFSPTPGSDFTLFRGDDMCRLQVVTGHVGCIGGDGREQRISAGQSLVYQGSTAQRSSIDQRSLSWRRGMLTAERTLLGEFIPQLARYRNGYLGVDDDIANLTLSGSFTLIDTDAVLDNLCQILPIRQKKLGRLWVRLVAT